MSRVEEEQRAMGRLKAVTDAIRRASEDRDAGYPQIAQAAIEANDAWLVDEGYRICAIDPANTPLTQEFVDRLYSKSKPE